MKKFFLTMEDLWIAAAFAEAGVYESLEPIMQQPRSREAACLRVA